MSNVDLLRKAAAKIRERAQAASKGRWKYPYRDFPGVVGSKHGCLWTSAGKHAGHINNEPDAEHIASWDPTVALAVADSVDLAADWTEEHPGSWPPWCKKALAVARAYLRGG